MAELTEIGRLQDEINQLKEAVHRLEYERDRAEAKYEELSGAMNEVYDIARRSV